MRSAIVLILLSATAALAQTPTYRDVIAAKRAGSNPPPRVVHSEVIRRVVSSTASNAMIVFITPGGETRTDLVHYAVMYGAAQVQTQQAARVAEQAALARLALTLAQRRGTATNALLDGSAAATQARADLYAGAADSAAAGNTLPLAGAAAAGALVAGAGATLLRRKSTGPGDPSDTSQPPASADGGPTT